MTTQYLRHGTSSRHHYHYRGLFGGLECLWLVRSNQSRLEVVAAVADEDGGWLKT